MTTTRFSEIIDRTISTLPIGFIAPVDMREPLGETVAFEPRNLYSIGRYASRTDAIRALQELGRRAAAEEVA